MKGLELLDRRIYAMADVDLHLGLRPGTAKRWIDGYSRAGQSYEPVIRPQRTRDDSVSWGEFVETQLLAGYRSRGVPLRRLRPAVQRVKQEFDTPYPLAFSAPFLEVSGRELVRRIQEETDTDRELRLVVVRNNQLVLADPAQSFADRVVFGSDGSVRSMRVAADTPEVRIDPLRQYGQPVVRSVPTSVLAEGFRAGESVAELADLYELTPDQVQQAIRFEMRASRDRDTAA